MSYLPKDILKSFNLEQLQNLNIEQIKSIPTSIFGALSGKQMTILNQILYPFKSSEEIVNLSQKATNDVVDILIES
ncbi:unnamed protein product, partial [Rotaria magnacalcarata]